MLNIKNYFIHICIMLLKTRHSNQTNRKNILYRINWIHDCTIGNGVREDRRFLVAAHNILELTVNSSVLGDGSSAVQRRTHLQNTTCTYVHTLFYYHHDEA